MRGLFVFSRRVCFVCFLINFNFVSVGRAALLRSTLSLVGPDYRVSPSAGGGGGGGRGVPPLLLLFVPFRRAPTQ